MAVGAAFWRGVHGLGCLGVEWIILVALMAKHNDRKRLVAAGQNDVSLMSHDPNSLH